MGIDEKFPGRGKGGMCGERKEEGWRMFAQNFYFLLVRTGGGGDVVLYQQVLYMPSTRVWRGKGEGKGEEGKAKARGDTCGNVRGKERKVANLACLSSQN